MIKSDLVRLAGQNPHLFRRDVGNVVDAVLDEVVAALTRGDRVELRGFGSFSVKAREGRVGRNPMRRRGGDMCDRAFLASGVATHGR